MDPNFVEKINLFARRATRTDLDGRASQAPEVELTFQRLVPHLDGFLGLGREEQRGGDEDDDDDL